jgi:hypothetical protein
VSAAAGEPSWRATRKLLLEVDEGRYDFRHALARQAVEEAIPSPMRRRLHLRAAARTRGSRRQARGPAGTPLPGGRQDEGASAEVRERLLEWIRFAEAAADRAKSLEDDATAYRFLKEAVAVPGLFGFFPFPHDNPEQVTKTITYNNGSARRWQLPRKKRYRSPNSLRPPSSWTSRVFPTPASPSTTATAG